MQIAREITDAMRALLHDAGTNQFCMLLLGVIVQKRSALAEELVNLDPVNVDFPIYYAIMQSRLETLTSVMNVLTAQLPPVPAVINHNNIVKMQ